MSVFRICLPIALAALAAAWGLFAPPLVQSQAYHHFADARAWLSIPNAADTLSNLAFLLVGALGLAFLRRERAEGTGRFDSPREMRPWWVFFAGVALTSVGSGWYHLAPDDARLVWDRLPMTVAFMSLLSAIVGERISVRAGDALLAPLLVLGVASVAWWRWSALAGFENLRPYMAVQFGSIAVILAIAALYHSRYTHGALIFAVAAFYALAKVLETYDREIYALGHLMSGHTAKHLAAAAGIYLLVAALERRRPRWAAVSPPSSARPRRLSPAR